MFLHKGVTYLDFSLLNTIDPCLVSVANILKCPEVPTSYGKRTVEHYELDFITWGDGYIITNEKKYAARKGELFLRTPGMVVEGFAPYHCYFIVFDLFPNTTSISINKDKQDFEFPEVMTVENQKQLEDLFYQLFNEYIIRSEVYFLKVKTYLQQIILILYQQWKVKNRFDAIKGSLSNYKKILFIKEYIENNFDKKHTLDQLAEKSGFSRYFFCRIFKDVVGESPINYVNKCRTINAKRLLLETSNSIKKIMIETGFDNESHFFKLFKQQVGSTPSEFRDRNKGIYNISF
jgi:AraC-like DNA-binding protein